MTGSVRRPALLVACAILGVARPGAAQQLGALSFPTSGPAAAQVHFVRGVLYLHSFEYESALGEFREAERIAPAFAMAYWGDAMTWTHPVWNQQNADSARATLARLGATAAERAAKAPTERERGYLHAVEILYGPGTKPTRDTAYSAAMEDLARRFPQDDEAQLFYALSLLGLSQGNRDIPTYMRAGAIALRVFQRHPDHPGAAHYAIHAFDDPVHAPLGLDAARAYSHIAPDAAHAQHMTSHIFLALGLWDDVVTANIAAVRVTAEARRRAGRPARGCGHYPEWLEYGYLQQGRLRDAARILDDCLAHPAAEGTVDDIEGLAGMRAAYLVDSRTTSGPYVAEPEAVSPGVRAYMAFGTGYAAARRGDRAALTNAVDHLARAAGQMAGEDRPYGEILLLELRGLAAAANGDTGQAVALVWEAARRDDALPMPFGPPLTVKPPHELAGDLLLAAGKFAEAHEEFRAALARTPRRPAALLERARSSRALGRRVEARSAYTTLATIWHAADDDLDGLREARESASVRPR